MEKLIEKVTSILTVPKVAWQQIKAEEDTQMSIIRSYLVYLAAIPAIASFIGRVIVGTTNQFTGLYYRVPFFSGLLWSILLFVLTIAGVYLSALAISALAPNFGGAKNDLAAFKLVVYSYTAPLVAGIFNLLPSLSVLSMLGGLYGIYLLYLGLPILMENPKEKNGSYAIVAVLVLIVIYFVMGGFAALAL